PRARERASSAWTLSIRIAMDIFPVAARPHSCYPPATICTCRLSLLHGWRVAMTVRGRLLLFCAALIAFSTISAPLTAQITTASVAGNVHDLQGAVLPGATVSLISETRGTRLADVVTDATGGFTFVNVPPDRYTLQIALEGFKTLKRTGLVVGAGERLGLGSLTIELGGIAA